MKSVLKLLFSLLFIGFCSANSIDIQQDSHGFNVSFKDVLLLQHHEDNPLIILGNGTFEAKNSDGNWMLNDTIEVIYPLDQFDVGKTQPDIRFSSLIQGLDYSDTLDGIVIRMTSSVDENVGVVFSLKETDSGQMELHFSYVDFWYQGRINRFFLNLPAKSDEIIYGGGEQFSYFNLREGERYPIWVMSPKV